MGRETKIGLGVIGVLLLVFGGLLFRKLAMPDAPPLAEEAAAAVQALTSAGMAEQPLVTLKQDQAQQARGVDPGAESAEVPAAAYLPVDDAEEHGPRENLHAPRHRHAAADGLGDEDAGSSANPFPRRRAVSQSTDNEPRDDEAGEEPRRLREPRELSRPQTENARPLRPGRNPVRRASAAEPLDDRATADEFAAGREAPSADAVQEPESRVDVSAEPTPHLAAVPPEDRREADARVQQPPAQDQWQRPAGGEQPSVANNEPAVPPDGKYSVQPNDTLWTISEKVYGNGRYFKAIYEHNRSRLPHADRLTVGTVIEVPPVSLLEQNYASLCPKQRRSALVKSRALPPSQRPRTSRGDSVYVVEEGDTLFDIARYELGKASRWGEIYDLNRQALGEDFDYLQPGTELQMPPRSQAVDSTARGGDSRYQR